MLFFKKKTYVILSRTPVPENDTHKEVQRLQFLRLQHNIPVHVCVYVFKKSCFCKFSWNYWDTSTFQRSLVWRNLHLQKYKCYNVYMYTIIWGKNDISLKYMCIFRIRNSRNMEILYSSDYSLLLLLVPIFCWTIWTNVKMVLTLEQALCSYFH